MPARADSNRSRTNLQAVTIEYVTTGAFDGRTVATPISPENTEPDPADGIYRKVLENGEAIGLIDLSFSGVDTGGMGDRYVRKVLGGAVGGPGSFAGGILGVSDNVFVQLGLDGNPVLVQSVRTLNSEGFYSRSCILVPQGCYLSVSGLPAASAGVNILRITVDVPETPWHGALLEDSCCCSAPDASCPGITAIIPSEVEQPLGRPASLTIEGSGFFDGVVISGVRVQPDDGAIAGLSGLTVVDPNTITVNLVTADPGVYGITISDPNDPDCFGTGELTVTPPFEGPV